jgi:tRNA-specific 2-thiouridylase
LSKNKTVVVGMSGGVDSSVAALLLKQQGFNVIGVHMNHLEGVDNTTDVSSVCKVLGIPFHVVDYRNEFEKLVIARTRESFAKGLTPNPCCFCNRDVKFKLLVDMADKLGADFVATGHYREQFYFLCALAKNQFSRALFPLRDLTKKAVREIAKSNGLVTHDKPASTDICFEMPKPPLTIGQRAGLGGQSQRMYVIGKGPDGKAIVGLDSSPELYTKVLTAKGFNWLVPSTSDKFECLAKVRYRQPDQQCIVEVRDGVVSVTFKKPQRAVTPGQWVVLYNGDVCLGGGEICETK